MKRKKDNNKSPKDLLESGMEASGLKFDSNTIDLFMDYMGELKKWNKVHNLTAIRKDKDIIVKHFLDSLLYLKVIEKHEVEKTLLPAFLLDVGSGAGFPGIPIKIVSPEFIVHLLEPKVKKAAFLNHIVAKLKLKNVKVINKRIEDLDIKKPFYDVAVVRALFGTDEFIHKVEPIMKTTGLMVLSKTEAPMNGDFIEVKIPGTNIPRTMIIKYPTSLCR